MPSTSNEGEKIICIEVPVQVSQSIIGNVILLTQHNALNIYSGFLPGSTPGSDKTKIVTLSLHRYVSRIVLALAHRYTTNDLEILID